MFSKKCGATLQEKDNKLICPQCGAEFNNSGEEISGQTAPAQDVSATPAETPDVKPRGFSSKKNILIVILAAILVLGIGAGITVVAVNNSPARRVSRGIELAERYLSEQNYEQAIIEYEKVLEIEPMNVEAYLGLADVYEEMGDKDKAVEILKQGIEQTHDDRLQQRLDEILKPAPASSVTSTESAPPAPEPAPQESSEPVYGSMGSVTIQGEEYDIATTYQLEIYDGDVTDADVIAIGKLVNLFSISLGDCQINDITPLENLDKLDSIDIEDNSCIVLSDLVSLENHDNIKCLKLVKNQINDFSLLAQFEKLESLTVFREKDINNEDIRLISNNTNLKGLQIGGSFTDITPLTKFTNLESLNLSSDQIVDIAPLTELANLRDIILQHFPIDVNQVANLKQLESLSLCGGGISDISPLASLTNLTGLDLYANEINDITPLANLTNLTYLDLRDNQVSDITPLANLTNLEWLELDYNQISDITPLEKLTKLNTLNLTDNQISNITPLANLTNLEELYLSLNQITDVTPLANLTNLRWLLLEYNQISDITPLTNLTKLKNLQLHDNLVGDEEIDNLKSQLPNCRY